MIIDWQEVWEGRGGSLNCDKATRKYVRTFRAVTDDATDGPATILQFAQLEGLLTTYEDANGTIDQGAILRDTHFDQDQDDPFIWLVRCEFSSEPYDVQQRDGEEENPLDRPPIFTLSATRFARVLNQDVYGNAVTNSAGASFSPLPECDDTRFVLTMERNEATPDWPTILGYQDAINSDVFLGFLPGTAKVSVSATAQFENGLYYWKTTYVFEMRTYLNINGVLYSAWDTHILDRGFDQLDSSGNLTPIWIKGDKPSDPVSLDGSGHQGTALAVTSVAVAKVGLAYTDTPTVTFAGGGGTGATAIAVLSRESGAGAPVAQIIVTSPGANYTSAPTVAITGGGGSGATAVAVMGPAPAYRHYRSYNWLPFAVFNLPSAIN